MNNLQLLLVIIIFLTLVLLIFYNYLYRDNIKDSYKLIDDVLDIEQTYQETVPLDKLYDITKRNTLTLSGNPEGEGLTFIWNMFLPFYTMEKIWFTSYDKDKPILRIGESPQIIFNPRESTLKVIVQYKSTQFTTHYPIIELRDIPLQKWNRFVVVVKSNEVKIYLNGEIKINKKLINPIIINNDDITLGDVNNNIIGKISDLRIVYRPLNTFEVRKEF